MEPVNASAPSRSLTEREARALTESVKANATELWTDLLRLYQGDAHKSLGYSSWADYCAAEFEMTKDASYRVLRSARVVAELEISNSPLPRNQAQVRELARVVPEQRAETWQAVVEQHGEKPTAEQVRQVVQERYDLPPARVLTPTPFVPGPMAEPIDVEPRPLHDIASRIRGDENQLLENVADADDLALDRVRHQFWHHWKYLGLLIHLEPDAIAAVLDRDQPSILRQCFTDTRAWMDAIEKAIEPRGLRVVS